MAPIIEVAIGLIFIFSLLSILVTQINTLVSNLLNWRARQLKEGLIDLVSDRELQAKILAHPLVRMVEAQVSPTQDLTNDQVRDIIHSPARKVTYIAPNTFVEALVSLLSVEGGTAMFDLLEQGITALPESDQKIKLRELLRDLRSFGDTDTSKIRQAILELEDENHKSLLSYALEVAEDSLGKASVKSGQMIPLLEGINRVKDRATQDAIRTILVTAHNLQEAQAKLERWFNDGMGRASDIYKRRIGYVSVIVGLVIAVLLNVDTFHLARALWEDPSLRQAVANAARDAAQDTQPTGDEALAPADASSAQATADAAQQVQETLNQLLSLNLPIGWEFTPVTDEMLLTSQAAGLPDPRANTRNLWNLIPGNSPDWLGNVLRKFIGWLVTVVALAQGAPFWFDLLRRLTGGNSPSSSATTVNLTVNGKSLPPDDNLG